MKEECSGKEVERIFQEADHIWAANNEDVLVNCIGVVKNRRDKKPRDFIISNSFIPHDEAQVSWRVINISTDCVFDGNHAAPYSEDDLPTPTDLYGRSKLAGEIYDPHLTIRTSFVGIGKRGLLHDLMEAKGSTMRVSRLALWTGHTTIALSRIILQLAERNVSGLLHIPAEAISRPNLIRKLSDAFDLGITVIETSEPAFDRRLMSHRWEDLHMPEMQTLDEEISELAEQYKQ